MGVFLYYFLEVILTDNMEKLWLFVDAEGIDSFGFFPKLLRVYSQRFDELIWDMVVCSCKRLHESPNFLPALVITKKDKVLNFTLFGHLQNFQVKFKY